MLEQTFKILFKKYSMKVCNGVKIYILMMWALHPVLVKLFMQKGICYILWHARNYPH